MYITKRLMHVATGFRVVDTLFTIATGQRELVIGDRQCGKTYLCCSAVISQFSQKRERSPRKSIWSIFCGIAQKCSAIMRLNDIFEKNHVMLYTTVVFTSPTSHMSLVFINPLSGTVLAEFFRNRGFHSLLVYDDLSKHAVSYRQVSLFLRKPAGREAFPSDVFFIHARLLERSTCLNFSRGSGTITCLPVIETLNNDLSAYVATNVVSITDGQLYLDSVMFGLGVCPSVSTEKSVSRVGAKSLD